jgi:hypothetical protein
VSRWGRSGCSLNESRDGRRHPNDWDLYTPLTQEVIDLLVRMRRELGSWREVAYVAGKRMREIRRIYRVEVKVVSMSMMDRLCQGSGVGHAKAVSIPMNHSLACSTFFANSRVVHTYHYTLRYDMCTARIRFCTNLPWHHAS